MTKAELQAIAEIVSHAVQENPESTLLFMQAITNGVCEGRDMLAEKLSTTETIALLLANGGKQHMQIAKETLEGPAVLGEWFKANALHSINQRNVT